MLAARHMWTIATLGLAIAALGACDDPVGPEDRGTIESFSLGHFVTFGGADVWDVNRGALVSNRIVFQATAIHRSGTITDGWIEAEVDSVDDGGIVFRFQDNDNYYVVALRDDETSTGFSGANSNLELYRRVDGGFQSFAGYGGVDVVWPRGAPRRVRVHVIDDEISVYFGSERVIQATDDHFASGRLGLRHNSHYGQPVSVRYRSLHWGAF